VLRAINVEVVSPDVIAVQSLVADAAVRALPWSTTTFSLFYWNLEVFLLPRPMTPLEVHPPPRLDQHLVNPFAAVTRIPLTPATQFVDEPAIIVRLGDGRATVVETPGISGQMGGAI
jgi:hypothetical protein